MKGRLFPITCLAVFLLALAGQWRFTEAFAWPVSDEPDGAIYLSLGQNLSARGIYSLDVGPLPQPTMMRLPGYPWMIAGVFAITGNSENAVRAFQVILTVLTCAAVALLAFLWEPARQRRLRAAAIAFALAVLCPFTAIYAGVIMSETLTLFLGTSSILAATWAFRARSGVAQTWRWFISGLVAGGVQLVRPEAGLFAAAVGFTLAGVGLFGGMPGPVETENRWRHRAGWILRNGAVFSCAFIVTLVPWTLRNAAVFHVFAPLPDANATAPGELDPRGFCAWYRTWADSERYLEPFYWAVPDSEPSSVDDLPRQAFDSPAERSRTAALFKQYNGPANPDDPDSPLATGLTPELDAGFGQLASERRARSPWRYYVALPLKRAMGLWFVPHAQYYDFDGSLFPWSKVKPGMQFHVWLPIFFALMCGYTGLGLAGAWRLGRTGGVDRAAAWRWLALVVLIVVPRWAYLATLENTEPRYMVEVFPFLSVLGGLALAGGRVRSGARAGLEL